MRSERLGASSRGGTVRRPCLNFRLAAGAARELRQLVRPVRRPAGARAEAAAAGHHRWGVPGWWPPSSRSSPRASATGAPSAQLLHRRRDATSGGHHIPRFPSPSVIWRRILAEFVDYYNQGTCALPRAAFPVTDHPKPATCDQVKTSHLSGPFYCAPDSGLRGAQRGLRRGLRRHDQPETGRPGGSARKTRR